MTLIPFARARRTGGSKMIQAVFALLTTICAESVQAGLIYVPNHSFELPVTTYADPRIDIWEQNPEFLNLATGVFSNQAPSDPTFIHNLDGVQAGFLVDAPTVEVSLDYASVDWAGVTHQFQSNYEAGKTYDLTVGVIGGAGGMPPGSTLRIALYYRDALSNKVVIAARTITNSLATFPNTTNFVDFRAHLPVVTATDAWAGKYIGIQLLVTSPAPTGAYWDVDNVRLTSTLVPIMGDPALGNGQFQFTVQSEPGLKVAVLATTNVTLPLSNWTSVATVTNTSGNTVFTDAAGPGQRFYQLLQLP